MSYIKNEFMKRILDDEGKRLLKNQGKTIRKELHFHTNTLIRGRTAEATISGDDQAKLKLSFPIYQRFLDIRKGTRRKGGGKRKSAKGYRIHNRFMMGHFLSIGNRMGTDFTEEVVTQIKKDLKIKGGSNG